MEFVPNPGCGRLYAVERRVHLGDVDGEGHMRLEALARFFQDVATDDADDSGLTTIGGVWVVRRLAIVIESLPYFHDRVDLVTFCSGTGPRWAERRTTLTNDKDAHVEAAAVWVLIDGAGGRPMALDEEFHAIYGESTMGRRVSSRLSHQGPPTDASSRPWVLRESDFDVLEHVNNARYLEAVDEELTRLLPGAHVRRAEFEYRGAVERGDELILRSAVRPVDGGTELHVWLLDDGDVRMSAVVATATDPEPRRSVV